jgi:hypothetical protein
MGAVDISELFLDRHFGDGPLTAHEVFERVHAQARDEFGFDPYNGSWSTLSGVSVLPGPAVPVWVAQAIAQQRFADDAVVKGGPALAIPVSADVDASARTVTVSVTLTGDEYTSGGGFGQGEWGRMETVQARLPAAVKLRAAEVITATTLKGWTFKQSFRESREGDVVTVFTPYVMRWGKRSLSLGDYPSLTAAKQAARARLAANGEDLDVSIESRKIRSGGGPLLQVSKQIGRAAAQVEVTLTRVDPRAKRVGWYLFGLAAC